MYKEVTLSDGRPCSVKVLGIFELDRVAPGDEIGPFFYQYEMVTGQVVKDIYDPTAVPEPPPKPTVPRHEAAANTPLWHAWAEYETYQAAVAHHERQAAIIEQYAGDVSGYILRRCIADGDRDRIVTEADWHAVCSAALVPMVTEEKVADVLRHTFQG